MLPESKPSPTCIATYDISRSSSRKPLPSVIDNLKVGEDYNIILTTRKHSSIPMGLWNTSYFIFIGE